MNKRKAGFIGLCAVFILCIYINVFGARLPIPGYDDDIWATVLNEYLLVSHQADGTLEEGIVDATNIDASDAFDISSTINVYSKAIVYTKTESEARFIDHSSVETLSNKTLEDSTLTIPIIANFSSATHGHTSNDTGGVLSKPIISNFTSAQHDHSDTENGGFLNLSTNTHAHTSDSEGGSLAQPYILDFTDAQHDHSNVSNGGIASTFLAITSVLIGDWNMDTTGDITVAHGLNASKIRSVTALIKHDSAGSTFPLDRYDVTGGTGITDGGVSSVLTSTISLYRRAGGTFDSDNFDSTSFNRGWMAIMYVP